MMFVTRCFFKLVFVVASLQMETVKASDDIADYLWNESKSFQQAALNSAFVQGLKNVSLNPSDFGAYMIQDAVYMYMSKEFIDVAVGKTIDPDLKQFLQEKANSYESLYLDLFKKWHIADPRGIILGTGCQNYVNHLKDVVNTKDPIYLVVAMIPCVKLWPWLGDQIDADFGHFGVYTKWIKEDFDPDYKGYKLYENMVNNVYKEGTVDKDEALVVYQASMKGEVDFFSLL
ncbi:uncharacterized protein LOC132714159 [Ruditapes philippinarum]|uniref:uncharacterized protein LOC132714159 n=1 Tax=Ruditapes philippinarum TaxID=129788 RepID=UPI00295ADF29|nr:uncharacterized protein LOC132714159 [Ruditapes philippinarum]XP_060552924.1 uncharacterized protein LOC132714159 [Ruditapes philippinarum]